MLNLRCLQSHSRIPNIRAPTGSEGSPSQLLCSHQTVLIVVEGRHDSEFLRRITAVLRTSDPSVPDLNALEGRGRILFLHAGGDPQAWTSRLSPLGMPELHLSDSEMPPDSNRRFTAAALVNARPRCRAFVTRKRSVENYLHPAAIREARNVDIEFGDRDCVPELAARCLFGKSHAERSWDALPHRVRRRLRDRAKRWLNTDAVERMTLDHLKERDPAGEVASWLQALTDLIDGRF